MFPLQIIQQVWPYMGEYTKVFLKEFIEPQVRAQLPAPFKSFKFVSVDMGDIPFRVVSLRCPPLDPDHYPRIIDQLIIPLYSFILYISDHLS